MSEEMIDMIISKVIDVKSFREEKEAGKLFDDGKSYLLNMMNNGEKLSLRESAFCFCKNSSYLFPTMFKRVIFMLSSCNISNSFRNFLQSSCTNEKFIEEMRTMLSISDYYRRNNEITLLTDEETYEYMKTQEYGQEYVRWINR